MRIAFSVFFLSTWLFSASQNIAAFSDYQNRFFVFDDGKIRQLEHLPVLSFETGDDCIAYLTNSSNFKIYHNHIAYEVAPLVSSYQVTNHLVSYANGSQLYVFDGGNKVLLSKYTGEFRTNDSLIAFFDTFNHYFQVYYKGEIITLEDGLLHESITLFKTGPNMLAYIDAYENFKVFYQNQVFDLMKTNVVPSIEVGRNILAFIDPLTDYLQVFYNNELQTIEAFKPESFQVAYDKVAFISNTGDFKLFDKGELYTITPYSPDYYELKYNMLVYHQQNQLFAFFEGQNYLIENYIPDSYKINDNSIAYIDQNGNLQLFTKGEHVTLSYEQINSFQVLRNVVIFNEGMNTTKIFYNNKTYTP
ncbi:MAG: hypothetical protein AB7S69_06890 [Salinivirgaceae bacterium]